jgi:hypothetical protein
MQERKLPEQLLALGIMTIVIFLIIVIVTGTRHSAKPDNAVYERIFVECVHVERDSVLACQKAAYGIATNQY